MYGRFIMEDMELDLTGSFISDDEMEDIKPEIMKSHEMLLSRTGISSDMTGWIDYPEKIGNYELSSIKKAGEHINKSCDVLVVIGIGGSYLGANAAIEAVRGNFHNDLCCPKVYFAGHNLSGAYLRKLIESIRDKEVCVIVISKSGTTLEPAVSFRVMRDFMTEKYGDNARERIFAVTDEKKGALKSLADKCGYSTFVIPDDIGGRYSVITPVGLLPMAAAGLDIESFIKGTRDALREYSSNDFSNICCRYAAARNILNRKGKEIEILVGYEPSNISIAEWWKQLFGESEGKNGKGIFPASLNFTTDLHSMGQYVQEGSRIIFETTVLVKNSKDDMLVPTDENDYDKLNYISGRKFSYINEKAFEGTFMAHGEGYVPGIIVKVPEMNEYYTGKLFYFFMMSCGISGYLNGIDPFTQPGVEAYKRNMFGLLGK
jgi:glucose-6-phosphate isomerase